MNIQTAKPLINLIINSGKSLLKEAGSINDIGIKKKYLTQEDLNIERGIKTIVQQISGQTSFYAEEENDIYKLNEDIWVCDPISGTKLFIEGLPHYTIVASHLTKGVVDFAVVYDPSTNNLFTADQTGAYLNNKKIKYKTTNSRKIIFAPTGSGAIDINTVSSIQNNLSKRFEVFTSQGSFALNYCLVAIGKFDGVVSITKDSYPEFAGCFIANKSGCIATNIDEEKNIKPIDRKFIC